MLSALRARPVRILTSVAPPPTSLRQNFTVVTSSVRTREACRSLQPEGLPPVQRPTPLVFPERLPAPKVLIEHTIPIAPPVHAPDVTLVNSSVGAVRALDVLMSVPPDAEIAWHARTIPPGADGRPGVMLTAYAGPSYNFGNGPHLCFVLADADASHAVLIRRYFEHASSTHVWYDYSAAMRTLADVHIVPRSLHADVKTLAIFASDASTKTLPTECDLPALAKTFLFQKRFNSLSTHFVTSSSESNVHSTPTTHSLTPVSPSIINDSCLHACFTRELHTRLTTTLSKHATHTTHIATDNGSEAYNIRHAYSGFFRRVDAALAAIEARGLPVCTDTLRQHTATMRAESARLYSDFKSWAERHSPGAQHMRTTCRKQLRQVLFAPCVNSQDRTKTIPKSDSFPAATAAVPLGNDARSNSDGAKGNTKKSEKNYQNVTLVGAGITPVVYTNSGWPSTSTVALRKTAELLRSTDENCGTVTALDALVKADTLRRRADNVDKKVLPIVRSSRLHVQHAHDASKFCATAAVSRQIGADEIRAAVRAPDGHKLLVVQPRWPQLLALAQLSRCPALVSLINSGDDIYGSQAVALFEHVATAVTSGDCVIGSPMTPRKGSRDVRVLFPKEYNVARIVSDIAAVAGGPGVLSKRLDVPSKEAAALLERWDNAYPGVPLWRKEFLSNAAARGATETMMGRVRKLGTPGTRLNVLKRTRAVQFAVEGSAREVVLACSTSLENCERLAAVGWHVVFVDGWRIVLQGPEYALRAALPEVGAQRLFDFELAVDAPFVATVKTAYHSFGAESKAR